MSGVKGLRVALLLALLPAAALADEVGDAIRECAAAIEQARTAGPPAQSVTSCPQLQARLKASPYADWLPREWEEAPFTPEGLEELESLLAAAEQHVAADAPDLQSVDSVLERLNRAEAETKVSAWQRFIGWLRERLRQPEKEPPQWLIDMFERLSKSSGPAGLSKLLLVLVVLAALLTIANELRAAGFFRRLKRVPANKRAPAGRRVGVAPQEIDIASAALSAQPSLILRRVLQMVSRSQNAADDASLTHRELRTTIRLSEQSLQTQFDALAHCAERTRYALREPTTDELTTAVAAGHSLLAALEPR